MNPYELHHDEARASACALLDVVKDSHSNMRRSLLRMVDNQTTDASLVSVANYMTRQTEFNESMTKKARLKRLQHLQDNFFAYDIATRKSKLKILAVQLKEDRNHLTQIVRLREVADVETEDIPNDSLAGEIAAVALKWCVSRGIERHALAREIQQKLQGPDASLAISQIWAVAPDLATLLRREFNVDETPLSSVATPISAIHIPDSVIQTYDTSLTDGVNFKSLRASVEKPTRAATIEGMRNTSHDASIKSLLALALLGLLGLFMTSESVLNKLSSSGSASANRFLEELSAAAPKMTPLGSSVAESPVPFWASMWQLDNDHLVRVLDAFIAKCNEQLPTIKSNRAQSAAQTQVLEGMIQTLSEKPSCCEEHDQQFASAIFALSSMKMEMTGEPTIDDPAKKGTTDR